jgi:hypothetical protein
MFSRQTRLGTLSAASRQSCLKASIRSGEARSISSSWGFEAGVDKIHFKHGLASLILALALFAFAWFQSAPQRQ